MSIRIILFDDNAKRRDGLEMLINSTEGMSCISTFNDCRQVIKKVKETQPDVVLMDIDMPFVNGIEGVLEIRKEYPDLRILMQTVFEDDDKVFNSICAGANGYILKQEEPARLIKSIEEVLDNGGPMTPVIAKKVLELFSKQNKRSEKSSDFDLTKRETEILGLLIKGYSYKMIASECFISYPTVNSHVSKIYKKLQVHSVSGAVSKALKERLV